MGIPSFCILSFSILIISGGMMQIATAIYFMTLNTNSWFGVVPGFFLLFTGTVGLLAATHRNANYALTYFVLLLVYILVNVLFFIIWFVVIAPAIARSCEGDGQDDCVRKNVLIARVTFGFSMFTSIFICGACALCGYLYWAKLCTEEKGNPDPFCGEESASTTYTATYVV
ncbi:hypothetical protein PROFUN_08613 [Planoprotostelium fungivorum]|uniref:MARVEL domain-containing protein n=1 Tax=Planoprotostelium fungivorum TaxID=1890364 RepID=A0A2P6NJ84_9EUKA|nr:hypothetical protein PROFUN_08613 [Planoprotostelium fungivorum]